MKTAKELYPNFDYFEDDYTPIIESFGDVLIRKDQDDYQGDLYILYKLENDKYGVLIFGWGSCSGCDALQACSTLEEVDELINQLHNEIKYFDNLQDVYKWLVEQHEENYYCSNIKEYIDFKNEIISLCENNQKGETNE